MFAFATWPLQWARSLGHRLFLQFGLHCATHQIRVILISCVVITSLFYPALDVYTSSRTSSQSIIDTLLSPNSNPLRAELDLVDLWDGHDTLRVHEDPVTRAKCSNGHALRVEKILIQSQLVEDDGALNQKILLSTYDLERRIQKLVSTADSPCLKKADGECLVVSPLAFWGYDRGALSSDENILDTLSYPNNVSIVGIPVTPHMVLAGRGSYEPHVGGGNKFDYATYLVLTFFFPRNICWGSSSEHSQWIQFVQAAASQSGEVEVQSPEATVIALEHEFSSTKGWSVMSAFVYMAYIGFFAYVAWSVRRMDAIHSRLGITFTALVEIAVSTVTSLSVCALVGFKITMVPWEILPIVIVFVGAENMFNLVDAVGNTSVTLSVKQRIAEGLSRAGTSNTLKVVAYNVILGVIAVFSVGAVRQFCAFAIVVLVAHWFLAHTFFMAVLSIDIARLELEELLRHDTSLVPTAQILQNGNDTENLKQPRSSLQKLVFTIKQLLKGRAATNISLLMLLAIAATLYYTTYTTSTSIPSPSVSSLHRPGAIARSKKTSGSSRNGGLLSYPPSSPELSTADQIWKSLNPAQTPLLHLRIEPPVKVTFNPHAGPSGHFAATTRSRYTITTAKIVLRFLTIMVVPIAATTGVLYGLLLYLLRNTELLEAQRHRLGADDEDETPSLSYAKRGNEKWTAKKNLEGEIKFSTLPRAFPSDVELVASSKDGKVIASVGFHNEVVVWNAETKSVVIKIDAGEIFLRMMGAGLGRGVALGMMPTTSSLADPTITCITVDEEGKYLAIGTRAGSVAIWSIDCNRGCSNGALRPLSVVMQPEGSISAVEELRFVETRKKVGRNPPPNGLGSEPNSPESKTKKGKGKDDMKAIKLLATYTNGTAVRWMIGFANDYPSAVYASPSGEATTVRAVLLPCLANGQTFIGLCLGDGALELVEVGNDGTFFKPCVLPAGNPHDLVWKVHACQTEIGGLTRLVVIAATESGIISLWDGFTGECISILDGAASGKVNQLRISPVSCETCHFCGQLPMESLSLAFSVDHVVRVEKLYVDETNMTTVMGTRRCSCSKASMQLQQNAQSLSRVSSLEKVMAGRRSRSNSNTAHSPGGSPRMSRIRLATAFEPSSVTSAFPVSGHGVHSRRASEKDGTVRRSSELLAVPPFPSNGIVANGDDPDLRNGDLSNSPMAPAPSGYSIWRNATVAYLTSINCERGSWDTSGDLYKGIRRKNRLQCNNKSTIRSRGPEEGLTNATLERWEMWSFDPDTATLRCSTLLSLIPEPSDDTTQPTSPKISLPIPALPSKQKTTSSFSFTSPRTASPYTLYTSLDKPGKPLARLPFTRVSPVLISPSHAVAGFGNTIGVFHFAS